MFMISRFLFGLGNLREWIWVKNSGNYMLQAIRNLYYVGWKLSNKDQNNWKFKNLGKFGVFKSRKMLNYMTGMQNWKLVGKEKKKKIRRWSLLQRPNMEAGGSTTLCMAARSPALSVTRLSATAGPLTAKGIKLESRQNCSHGENCSGWLAAATARAWRGGCCCRR